MNAVESVLAFDLSDYGLSPVQQLILIRLADIVPNEPQVTSEYLSSICNCSKLTVYSSIKKLKSVGAIGIKYKKGRANTYSLLFEYSQASSYQEQSIEDFESGEDFEPGEDFEYDDSEERSLFESLAQPEVVQAVAPKPNAKNIKNRNKRKKRKK